MTVLLVDNYDSFTFNLYQQISKLYEGDVIVKRNDEISVQDILEDPPDFIFISPGPGNPMNARDFGVCSKIINDFSGKIPILGICLGHQGIGYNFASKIRNANRIVHGKTSRIMHKGTGIFEGLPQGFKAARYHSLVVDNIAEPLEVIATTEDGEIMAIAHKQAPTIGIQFHPESFMTEHGDQLVRNFLRMGTPDLR